MGFRAVCRSRRSATDDPKNSSELRFRPCRWIVIDELFDVGSDSRLLVNTVSGRVVRLDLPLLRRYCFVATTHGGLFVLADKKPPHPAVVLNPFTGHMIRFKAPVPCYRGPAAAALSGLFALSLTSADLRSSPTLILVWDSGCGQYMAAPDTDDFCRDLDGEEIIEAMSSFFLMPFAIAGGIYAADGWQGRVAPLPVALAAKIFRVMRLLHIDPYRMYVDKVFMGFADRSWTGDANRFFLVESAGELLAIENVQPHLKIFRLDTDSDELEPVESIGSRAIFIGYRRCVSVSADKFPSVVSNCIYYIKCTDSSHDIYQYDLKTKKEERVCEAIDPLTPTIIMQPFLHPIRPTFAKPPFTILQLLSSY
uniref:KIB1-4 beta-propeller domain-containing protein n=1 Tax=Aegilops tauschii TaxID=37682 RepID=R7W061_AEGTA